MNAHAQFWRTFLLGIVALGLPAMVLVGVFVAYGALGIYGWRDTTPKGPLADPDDWPAPIRDLHAKMRGAGIDDPCEVYLLDGKPGSMLSTVVCRLPESDAAFGVLQSQLELQVVRDPEIQRRLARRGSPEWWPSPDSKPTYYASRRAMEGEKGDLYIAARDSEQGRIFIHYSFNF